MSTAMKAPWVVMRPTGNALAECQRCNTTFYVTVPVEARELLRELDAFIGRHRECVAGQLVLPLSPSPEAAPHA